MQVWRRRAYALGERIAERHSATLSYRVAMAYLMNTFALPTSRVNTPSQCAYQSECADQRLQERHWVSVHCWRQAGQTPPVSNVFHSCPQEQVQMSSLCGDQPQSDAADARAGRVVALLLLRLPIQRPRTIWGGIREGAHAPFWSVQLPLDPQGVRTRLAF